mgnify:CR=1 FL=1
MEIALHKHDVFKGHTAVFFQHEGDAVKEALRIIRRECSFWLKCNKNKPQNNNSVAEDVRIIRHHMKTLSYQMAIDCYNKSFGHELTLKLSYDAIGNEIRIF